MFLIFILIQNLKYIFFSLFILILNESFIGLQKWQHIKIHRGVEQNKLPCLQLPLILKHSIFEVQKIKRCFKKSTSLMHTI